MLIRGLLCAVIAFSCLSGCATTSGTDGSGASKLSEVRVSCWKDRCLARLKMRHGDTLSGKMVTQRFVVRTAMGDIYLPINEISSITFNVVEADNQDKVQFYGPSSGRSRSPQANQVSGHVEPETIILRLEATGQELSFGQDQIEKLENLGRR